MKPTGCQRLAVQAVDQLLRILFRKIQQILAETAPEIETERETSVVTVITATGRRKS